MLLQIIHPIRNPPIGDAKTLASLLCLADRYDAKAVLDAHKDYLPSTFVAPPSIHMYAIFCAYGREKEAEAAARRVSFTSLACLNPSPLVRLMTVEYYQRLLGSMVARDRRMREIVSRRREGIMDSGPGLCCDDAHRIYSSIMVVAVQAGFEADPCVRVAEELGLVSSVHALPLCRVDCKYNTSRLQRYAEALPEGIG